MDYTYFYKECFENDHIDLKKHYDFFFSGFDDSERTKKIYNIVHADMKMWINFPQYEVKTSEDNSYTCQSLKEDEAILPIFDVVNINSNSTICIDITGFVKPHLLFLLRYLQVAKNIQKIDILYSEPQRYKNAELTSFSNSLDEVRQIAGCYPSSIDPQIDNDILILSAGYDHNLISSVSNNKDKIKKKYILIGFPSLQPDMYQEGVLKVEKIRETLGSEVKKVFAPAFDPFVTASVIDEIINENPKCTNIYLSPLSTKAQTIGILLFYIWNAERRPVSIIYPFSNKYMTDTSIGIKKTWKYTLEFPPNLV